MGLFLKILLSVYHTSCVCKFVFPQFWKISAFDSEVCFLPALVFCRAHTMARQVLTFATTVYEVTALLWVIQHSRSTAPEHRYGASDRLNGASLQIRKENKPSFVRRHSFWSLGLVPCGFPFLFQNQHNQF